MYVLGNAFIISNYIYTFPTVTNVRKQYNMYLIYPETFTQR